MCGVVGLIGAPQAAREAFLGLTTLQHRGQDAAGILTHDSNGFHQVKNVGLVDTVFTRENTEHLTGSLAVGHTRYSTIGRGDLVDVQPFLLNYPFGLGMVHNGNIVNCDDLAAELKREHRRSLVTHSDSEIILNLLAEAMADSSRDTRKLSFEDVCNAVQHVYKKVNGSFSIVTMVADHGLIAFRDPFGIRPLAWGSKDSGGTLPDSKAHMFASESVAMEFNGYKVQRSLFPGEVIFIDRGGKVHSRILVQKPKRPCMFEWVYFASAESEIDNIPVYRARIELGNRLASMVKEKLEADGIKADLVAPVPDTSRTSATALAEAMGLPYREVLIKNRYIKRTFILDSQNKREQAVKLKLSPVRSEIAGKNIILVDDSIVRGTTSRSLIELVRGAGAKKVYFVSACPPIQHPCYYGIDFPSGKELIAHEKSADQIGSELGADGVIYMDHANLKDSLEVSRNTDEPFEKPCMACLDGDYPSDVSAGSRFAEMRVLDRAVVEGA